MYPAIDLSARLKAKAFHTLETQTRGKGMVWVSANELINLCLAFEAAAEGRVDNLEYSIKVLAEQLEKARQRLNQIANLSDADGEVFEIACQRL